MSKKFLTVILAGLIAATLCCGCNDTPSGGGVNPTPPTPPNAYPYKEADEIDYKRPASETYTNNMTLEGQWGANNLTGKYEYGTGDPFVMRYNGRYYLYPSTLDGEAGIKVFESDDTVNWVYRGFAVSADEETTQGAYAPEVIYYNGYFYMCQSKGGSGHYIYKSDNPTSGFKLISGNIRLGIDGAFHIDDNGELYILHTGGDCIEYTRVADIENTAGGLSTARLDAANLGGWVEGPGIIRRGEYSYLTYTGNHVLSKGYRVAYAYGENIESLNDFVQPQDNITLISTKEGFSGLGHSSNFYGRDLDSIYTAYHNLVGFDGPPSRHYNLDRYVTDGSRLTANGVTDYEAAMPAAPSFESDGTDLLREDGFSLSQSESDSVFTAEINFEFADKNEDAVTVCGYADSDNYYAITVSPKTDIVTLYSVTEGDRIELGSARLKKNNNYGALNTVRIESGSDCSYVYYNGMRVIKTDGSLPSGRIGGGPNTECKYTAFSNDAFGTSDFEAIKNLPYSFPATHYLKGENRGFKIKSAEVTVGGVRQGEKESTLDMGGYTALSLKDAGDWVKYPLNASQEGAYSVWAEVTAASSGAELEFIIDNKVLTRLTVPEVSVKTGSERVYLGTMTLNKGFSTLKVRLKAGMLEVAAFTFNAFAVEGEEFSDSMQAQSENFFDFNSNFTYSADGAQSPSSGEGMLLCGSEGNADYTFSCDLKLKSGSTGGLVFRTKDFSVSPYDTREGRMRGYFLRIFSDGAELIKYDYAKKIIGSLVTLTYNGKGLFSTDRENRVTVSVSSGNIMVEINGEKIFEINDTLAFTCGKVGVYSKNTVLTVSDFKYESL